METDGWSEREREGERDIYIMETDGWREREMNRLTDRERKRQLNTDRDKQIYKYVYRQMG